MLPPPVTFHNYADIRKSDTSLPQNLTRRRQSFPPRLDGGRPDCPIRLGFKSMSVDAEGQYNEESS
jgi:hypothetical protein